MNRICVLYPQWCPGELVAELLDSLRRIVAVASAWLGRRWRGTSMPGADLHIATFAVLLDLLHADEEPTGEQRLHLVAALGAQLGLERRTARALLREAERAREAKGVFASIRLVAESYSTAQKAQLVRIMNDLVRLDGVVTGHERYLVHKLSKLLRVDRARVEALDRRSRALVG